MNQTSRQVIEDALATWVGQDEVLDAMYATWAALGDSPSLAGLDSALTYQAQVGIIYTLAERTRLLAEWMAAAGEDGRSSEEWMALEPDPVIMAELNNTAQAQGIDRFFIYLYVHSHLLNQLGQPSPFVQMEDIRSRITIRPR